MSDKTIVALYDTQSEAETAVTALEQAGLSRTDISIVGRHRGGGGISDTVISEDAVERMGDRGAGSGLAAPSDHGDRSSTDRVGLGSDDRTPTAGHGLHRLAGIGQSRITGPLSSQFTGSGRGVNGGLVPALSSLGVPHDDAEGYAEGVRRGGSLIVARVDESQVDEAIRALERHTPVDLEDRRGDWRRGGWTGFDQSSSDDYPLETSGIGDAAARMRAADRAPFANDAASRTDPGTGREESVPIVEEKLEIGKRQVERGTVRVRSYIVETPVHEDVRLREETVTVERRTASDASLAAGADAFRERTLEVSETDEVPVVSKTTHVTGEVVVRKEVEDRVETVSDTVRRTEVEVEDARTKAASKDPTNVTPNPRR
jgi:uncharacterized protein (TIGR02271 family)